MRKIYIKLASSLLSVLMALAMVIGASYAWMTISESPAVNGINVSLGGGNTILLAPDLTKVLTDENGNEVILHYPGAFDEKLNLSQYDTYSYLQELAGLSPVSTADGLHWILPAYDQTTGTLLDVSKFAVDDNLSTANGTETGTYAYLDFWVVSPGAEYDLRVSTDIKTNQGSFLMELPAAQKAEDGSFSLAKPSGQVASVARVGFLVNQQTAGTAEMGLYSRSQDYNSRYKKLLGVYREAGEELDLLIPQQFTIYEPNATLHPALPEEQGSYVVTNPLIFDESIQKIAETDVSHILTAQRSGSWRDLDQEVWLEKLFQASVAGKNNMSEQEATSHFYQEYLDGLTAPYVSAGTFFTSTADLYQKAEQNSGRVTAEVLDDQLVSAGATQDVVITELHRNTPQRIRMFIWLEGQDADCANAASVPASQFSLGIELSGATK